MRKIGVMAVTVAILTLVLIAASCGGTTTAATSWVTVVEDVQDMPYPNTVLKSTGPFELTGTLCRLRYETEYARTLHVYLVPQNDSTKRQSLLDMQTLSAKSGKGETAIYAEPGTYHLEIEGLGSTFRYHLWVEEQR
jgi:hypothetical protein